jgi:steroid delta-isomerase-like uncharacterized protein
VTLPLRALWRTHRHALSSRVAACLHARDGAFLRIGVPSFIYSNLQEHTMHNHARGTFIAAAAALALTFGVSGCEQSGADGANADEVTRNEETARRFAEEVFGKGNYAYIDSAVSPDFVEHTPAPQYKPGIEGLKEWIPQMRQAFPDTKIEVLHVFGKGDLVALHVRQTGTNTGPMMGMPATNKAIDMRGVDVLRFKDGKAIEHWGYWEEMKMMQQLGMMPENMGMPDSNAAPGTPSAGGDSAAPGAAPAAPGGDTSITDTAK